MGMEKRKKNGCRYKFMYRHPPFIMRIKNDSHYLLLDHISGLKTLGTLGNIKLDLIALGQRLEAFALDSRVVDEYIIAAVVFNETKALGIVKPLYFACCQLFSPPSNV